MKQLLLCLVLGAALLFVHSAQARVERYAVIAGNNVGWKSATDLRYAEADALKVQDVLVGLGGFAPANVAVLRGSDAETLRRALIAMNDRIRQDMAGGATQALLFVYYSGHGDGHALHLGGSALELQQLEQLVRGSAATFRLLVVDACRSGVLTRVKGATAAPPLAIRTGARLGSEGLAFLTASSANEDAQESDALLGSFFTHYLTSGLLGAADSDRDEVVTLEEAYRYVSEATIRATSRTWAGTQHPTFRYELHGQGKLPLTTLVASRNQRATLTLPRGRTYLLMSENSQGAVVAELGATDTSRQLSVRPGRYFVRGRSDSFLLEGEIVARPGQKLEIGDDKLRRVEYSRLVRKGFSPQNAVHGFEAGYQLRSPIGGDGSSCQGAFVGHSLELSSFGLGSRIGFCRAGFENQTLTASISQLDLSARLAHAWDFPWITLDLGVSAGATLLLQTFDTRGAAPPRASFAANIGLGPALTLDLPGGVYGFSAVEAQTYFMRALESGYDSETAMKARFAGRFLLGFGKRF